MASEIKQIPLTSLAPNPMRMLAKYPYNEDKIAVLRRSIKDVGLWEGVIARKKNGGYEVAFGHHRVHAARQELGKDARIPVIVRELTDEQMLQFMGRENLEDYNADFLVMLESWEAGVQFWLRTKSREPQAVEVARLLGWTRPSPKGHPMVNATAEATSAASKLIAGGYIEKESLARLSVSAASAICNRVVAQHEMLEKMAKATKTPAAEVERSKKKSGKAGERVAKRVAKGEVAQRDIRGQVDVEAVSRAKQSPLFSMFGKTLADQIAKVCKSDTIAEKFYDIRKALGHLTFEQDVEVVERLAMECEHAAKRFSAWEKTFAKPQLKVVALKQVGGRS